MPYNLSHRLHSVFAAFIDGLSDAKRGRRFALGFACAYGAVWLLYGLIAKSSQDINADMAETVVWSREPALGYPKHPPLLAFAVKLWFAIFPLADWAFMLLAVVTVSAGIYLAFELCGVWLKDEKRAIAPLLLATIPFYNFFGLKFDQNSALIPLWALAMLALLRSLETRQAGWAALTGCAAAAAMLTKYWSGFLLVAMALTTLLDRRRIAYFRSAAPWITAFSFLVVALPHAIWLVHEHFPPLAWVTNRRIAESAADFLRSLAEYGAGTIGYAAPAIVLVALLVHPSGRAVSDSWLPHDAERRPAAVLFWTPLLLPIAVAVTLHIDLLSLWNGPALSLLPVMMLASPLVPVPRITAIRLAAVVAVVTLITVMASPFVALIKLKRGVENDAAYTRLLAAAAERQWRETTGAPLRLLAGPFTLVSPGSFYISDKPATYADFSSYLSPWIDEAQIAREGLEIICPAEDRWCLEMMDRFAAANPAARRSEVMLTRHWLGFAGPAKRFVIATVPPSSPG